MNNFWSWLQGLPKCSKGGRCNTDKKVKGYLFIVGEDTCHPKMVQGKSRYFCVKCKNETTKYGII